VKLFVLKFEDSKQFWSKPDKKWHYRHMLMLCLQTDQPP